MNAEALGFSNELWRLVLRCWDKSPPARPVVQELLRCLQDASHTWVPPLEYPIHDDLEGGAGLDLTTGDVQRIVTSALTSGLFVLMGGLIWKRVWRGI